MRQGTLGLFLIAPALALLAAVLAWPMLSAIVMSFQDVRVVGSDGPFIGLANYEKVLADPAFWRAAKLSLVWVVANAVVQTALALAAALILNQRFRGVQIARTWIILSWIVPTVVVVMIWRWLFSTAWVSCCGWFWRRAGAQRPHAGPAPSPLPAPGAAWLP